MKQLTGNIEICRELMAGSPRGMDLLFDVYYKRLVTWADTYLDNLQAAEDLVQEFLVDLWENRKVREWRPESLQSFLFISIRNRSLHELEKKDMLRARVDLEGIDEVFEEYNEKYDLILQELLTQLETLPPRTKEIMKGVFVKGMKYREVAEELGISVSTVKSMLLSSIEKLKGGLTKKELLELLFCCCRRGILLD